MLPLLSSIALAGWADGLAPVGVPSLVPKDVGVTVVAVGASEPAATVLCSLRGACEVQRSKGRGDDLAAAAKTSTPWTWVLRSVEGVDDVVVWALVHDGRLVNRGTWFEGSPLRTRLEVEGLHEELAILETRVALAEQERQAAERASRARERRTPPSTASGPSTTSSPADEDAATTLLTLAQDAFGAGDIDGARKHLDALQNDYPRTRANRIGGRVSREMNWVGEAAPHVQVEHWYQGQTDPNAKEGETLLLFWEVSDPHSTRAIPEVVERLKLAQGLRVVGLTSQSQGVTPSQVVARLGELSVPYPNGRFDNATHSRYAIQYLPHAVVVKDGVIAWRGHPDRLPERFLPRP